MKHENVETPNKIALIIIWYGSVPDYFDAWSKSVNHLSERYDFLLFGDCDFSNNYIPPNVKIKYISMIALIKRIEGALNRKVSIIDPRRFCEFRPMYGEIFKNELSEYQFWGHADLDVIWGDMSIVVNDDLLNKTDLILNGGHFSIYRNSSEINTLYQKDGALFPWENVIRRNAVFAFDEVTGIHAISRKAPGNFKLGGIEMVDVDPSYSQFRSRMASNNPDYQAFYYENGHLVRVKIVENEVQYKELCYIHIPKRNLHILEQSLSDSFWITPAGYINKKNLGWPSAEEIKEYNPYPGKRMLKYESLRYKIGKIKEILKRPPYQIYVRLRQEQMGINSAIGKSTDKGWIRCDCKDVAGDK